MFKGMLESLKKFAPDMSQLIVYDNASKNAEDLKKVVFSIMDYLSDDAILYILSDKNNGFGAAHNIALKSATGEYFAVVNDDIEFFSNWTTPMIEVLSSDNKIAQVNPKKNVCNCVDMLGHGYGIQTDEPEYCEGSCFMMRTELAKEFGLFDDIYEFGYFEDADLSLRLRKAGYKLRSVDIDWIHYRSVTSNKVDIDLRGYYTNNEYKFKKRWNAYLFKKRFGDFIVIRRTGANGDVFLVTPIIEALKQEYPDCAIGLMTKCPQSVLPNETIDIVLTEVYAPVVCSRFIDLDNVYERDFTVNIVDAYAREAGISLNGKCRRGIPYITEKHQAKIEKILPKDFGNFVAIDLSDSWKGKEWSLSNYGKLVEMITEDGMKVVSIGVIGGYTNYIKVDLDFVNMLDILETMALLYKTKIFIANEGLTVHMAQAVNTLTIALYGCTLPQYTNDINSKSLFPVISPVKCVGCRHRPSAGNMIYCRRGYECMKRITPEMVFDKYREVKKLLSL